MKDKVQMAITLIVVATFCGLVVYSAITPSAKAIDGAFVAIATYVIKKYLDGVDDANDPGTTQNQPEINPPKTGGS